MKGYKIDERKNKLDEIKCEIKVAFNFFPLNDRIKSAAYRQKQKNTRWQIKDQLQKTLSEEQAR